jgi:hypothetical protein
MGIGKAIAVVALALVVVTNDARDNGGSRAKRIAENSRPVVVARKVKSGR